MDDQKKTSAVSSDTEKTARARPRAAADSDGTAAEKPATVIRRRASKDASAITSVSAILGAAPAAASFTKDEQASGRDQERPLAARSRGKDGELHQGRSGAGTDRADDTARRPQRRGISSRTGEHAASRSQERGDDTQRISRDGRRRGDSARKADGPDLDGSRVRSLGHTPREEGDYAGQMSCYMMPIGSSLPRSVWPGAQRVSGDGRRSGDGARKADGAAQGGSATDPVTTSVYDAARDMARARESEQAAKAGGRQSGRSRSAYFDSADRQDDMEQTSFKDLENYAYARRGEGASAGRARAAASEAAAGAQAPQKPREQQARSSAPAQPAQPQSRPAGTVRPAGDDETVRSVLVCWLGKIDVSASLHRDLVNPGPIRMLLENSGEHYDRVLLLTSQNQGLVDNFLPWLAPSITPRSVEVCHTQVRDMTDHSAVCAAIVESVDRAIEAWNLPRDGTGLVFHLSPGTPATHASMLLLAATRYPGVRLAQTKLPGIGRQPLAVEVTIPAIALQPHVSGGDVPEQTMRLFTDGTLCDAAEPEEEAPAPEEAGPLAQSGRDAEDSYATRYGRASVRFGRRRALSGASQGQEADSAALADDSEPTTEPEALKAVKEKLRGVAAMPLPILLLGESGCGKTRLARFIHEQSGRGGKFTGVDCAGLSDAMLTGALFGQRPGDYPGSWRSRDGAFRLANNGTIFLENVDAMPMSQQSMLLRVLPPAGETSVQLPACGTHPATTVHVRVIASATDGIVDAIRLGRFRADLYYRLAGVSMRIPSVREFSEEERARLLEDFLTRHERRFGVRWEFEEDAWKVLVKDPWPGNLREMSRMLQQIGLLSTYRRPITRDEVLRHLNEARATDLDDLVRNARDARAARLEKLREELRASVESEENLVVPRGEGLDEHIEHVRRAAVELALRRCGNNMADAACVLGMSVRDLEDYLG